MLQRVAFTSSGTKFQMLPALLRYEFVGCIENEMGSRALSLTHQPNIQYLGIFQDPAELSRNGRGEEGPTELRREARREVKG